MEPRAIPHISPIAPRPKDGRGAPPYCRAVRDMVLVATAGAAAVTTAAAALLSSLAFSQGAVTVSNVVPRTDSTGAYMDAHDGNTIQYTPGGPYFW